MDLKREDQLAWKIAAVAADPVQAPADKVEMIVNRVTDIGAVAIASVNRHPCISARDMALGHPVRAGRTGGATVFGMADMVRVSPEWAAWANGCRSAWKIGSSAASVQVVVMRHEPGAL